MIFSDVRDARCHSERPTTRRVVVTEAVRATLRVAGVRCRTAAGDCRTTVGLWSAVTYFNTINHKEIGVARITIPQFRSVPLKYFSRYAKINAWLSDHRLVRATVYYSPVIVFVVIGYLNDRGVIVEEATILFICMLLALWLLLWVIHRILLKIEMIRMGVRLEDARWVSGSIAVDSQTRIATVYRGKHAVAAFNLKTHAFTMQDFTYTNGYVYPPGVTPWKE